MKLYSQCTLRRGTQETTAWIETRGAKKGATVELLPDKELWEVVQPYGYVMPEHLLKEHQRMHRGSLPSVKRMV